MPLERGRKISRSLSPSDSRSKRGWQNTSRDEQRRNSNRDNSYRNPSIDDLPLPRVHGFKRKAGYAGDKILGKRNRSRSPYEPAPRDKIKHLYRNESPPPVSHKRPRARSTVSDHSPSYNSAGKSSAPRFRGKNIRRSPHRSQSPRFPVKNNKRSPQRSQSPRFRSKNVRRSPSPRPPPKAENLNSKKSQPKFRKASYGDEMHKRSSHSHKRSPTHKLSHDSRTSPTHVTALPPSRKVKCSGPRKVERQTLTERFTNPEDEPFSLVENVTIAILRNPSAEPSEEVTVKKVFDPNKFNMIHKTVDSRKPIFEREEIKVWRHDDNLADDGDFERRLVKVKPVASKSSTSNSLSRMSPGLIRKAFGLNTDKNESRLKDHLEPKVKLDPRPDPRYESKYREMMHREKRKESGREDKNNKYDLREALDKRRFHRTDPDEEESFRHTRGWSEKTCDKRNVVVGSRRSYYDDDDGGERQIWRRPYGPRRGRGAFRHGSWRHDMEEDGKEFSLTKHTKVFRFGYELDRGGRGGARGRGKRPEEGHKEGYPDENPYVKYNQHDDRDISPKTFRPRGRGRGFQTASGFRPARARGFRGAHRGTSYRPASVARKESEDREWKHDLYDSLQTEVEEPHSTT